MSERENRKETKAEVKVGAGTKDVVSKDMIISDILGKNPSKSQKLAQEMTNQGLHCASCGAATWETLEVGMLSHGKTEAEIDKLVDALNRVLAEEMDLTTISLTQRAAEKFNQVREEDGKSGWGLRFGDKAGGCSGFEYILDFEEKNKEDDEIFHSFGIDIYVNKRVLPRLLGAQIDYLDGLMGAGFKISNPNAKGSCSCGTSQAY